MIDSRKIQFNEIALHIESDAKTESVERTIQSFFKDYEKDRINLLSKLLNVIGKARIDLIVGDREFIGIEWVKYLKVNGIEFCMRVPKSH